MNILAIDTTENTATAAICVEDRLLGASQLCRVRNHSESMLPMIQSLLSGLSMGVEDLDLFAIAAGPGSFTGVRIGAATVKGLAFGREKPIVPVSALEAMAYNQLGYSGIVCPVMDARRSQMYNAIFRICGDRVERLCDDRVVLLPDLIAELKEAHSESPIRFCGSGFEMARKAAQEAGLTVAYTPEPMRYEHAWGTALCALEAYRQNPDIAVTDLTLSPIYLRASQAERERLEREQAANSPTDQH